jgi:hypothetical protein
MHLLLQPLFTAQKSSSLWNHSRDLWVAEPNFAPKLNKEKLWRLADEFEDQWSQSRSKWALDPCHKKSDAVWDLLYHEATKQVKDAHLHTTSLPWSTIFHLLLIISQDHKLWACRLQAVVALTGCLVFELPWHPKSCSCSTFFPSFWEFDGWVLCLDGSCDVCVCEREREREYVCVRVFFLMKFCQQVKSKTKILEKKWFINSSGH